MVIEIMTQNQKLFMPVKTKLLPCADRRKKASFPFVAFELASFLLTYESPLNCSFLLGSEVLLLQSPSELSTLLFSKKDYKGSYPVL